MSNSLTENGLTLGNSIDQIVNSTGIGTAFFGRTFWFKSDAPSVLSLSPGDGDTLVLDVPHPGIKVFGNTSAQSKDVLSFKFVNIGTYLIGFVAHSHSNGNINYNLTTASPLNIEEMIKFTTSTEGEVVSVSEFSDRAISFSEGDLFVVYRIA